MGQSFGGEVVEVGSEVSNLKVGDRVVVPFTIACGECFFCKRGFYSSCERSNPQKSKKKAETMWGHSPAGLFGYSHLLGGYPGGRDAESQIRRLPADHAQLDDGHVAARGVRNRKHCSGAA